VDGLVAGRGDPMTPESLALAARIRPCTKWPVGTRIYRPVRRAWVEERDAEGLVVKAAGEEDVVEVYTVTSVDPNGTVHAKGTDHDLCARVMPAGFGVPDLDDKATVEALATEAKLDPVKATATQIVTALESAATAKEG